MHRILVLGAGSEFESALKMETAALPVLRRQGFDPLPAHELFGNEREYSSDNLLKRMRALGVDGVISVVPKSDPQEAFTIYSIKGPAGQTPVVRGTLEEAFSAIRNHVLGARER